MAVPRITLSMGCATIRHIGCRGRRDHRLVWLPSLFHGSACTRPRISTRIILGLSVLVATNPDVLIYKNEGMDPVFARNIHEYLATHVTNSVFVFVQLNSSVLDEEICFDACPDSAICTLVDRGV